MPVRCAAVALAFILLCADFVSGSGKYKDAAVGAFHGAFELSARHPFSVTMVLARYKEDLSWIGGALSNNSKLSVDIYNDGGPDDAMFSAANGAGRGQLSEEKLPANVHVHPGDHLATEVGKYLLYIVDHYRHLPDVVCFAQAGVFEHSPDFLGLLSNAHAFRDFQPLGLLPHGEESEHSEAIEKGQTPGSYTINGNRIFVDFMDDSMQGRLFPSPWWERFSKNRLPPHSLHYFAALFGIFPPAPALKTYSSHFAVRRTVILKYPVAFYMHLVHWLRNGDIATASTLGTYRQRGYVLEYMWAVIFEGQFNPAWRPPDGCCAGHSDGNPGAASDLPAADAAGGNRTVGGSQHPGERRAAGETRVFDHSTDYGSSSETVAQDAGSPEAAGRRRLSLVKQQQEQHGSARTRRARSFRGGPL